jgi:hypothetical protein
MSQTLTETLNHVANDHRKSVDTLRVFVEDVHADILGKAADRDATAGFFMDHAVTPDVLKAVLNDSPSPDSGAGRRFADRIQELAYMQKKFPGLLLEMAFIYRVALFDAFIPDLIRLLLIGLPQMLKSKKQLSHQEILEQGEFNSLIGLMADKELQDFGYGSIKEQSRWVHDHLGLDLFSSKTQLDQVTELTARRNLFVHANGCVDRSYLTAASQGEENLGRRLDVHASYWGECDRCLTEVSDRLLDGILSKFCAP